ncbi:MAG: T9SS type A sorting domain-containing protein, partial [Bacteroidales bacterium]|nr:T9SS type A sorting domain-containing protein [Bacteroidales bacterium]
AVENNVYMWHGSEGVTFDSNQSPSVTISVASYPAAICVESQDENGCTSVSYCDTIPQTPPISILGNNVLCLQNMGFEWLCQEFQIESPSSGSNYVWSLSDNTMAELNPVSNGIEVRPFGIQGDVDLIVQEFRNGELVNEGRETLQIRVRPQSGNLAIYGPNDWKSLCPYEPNVQYSIPRQGNFIWSVPEDAQITSGQGTNSITITFGREGGDIFAREQNGEGCFAYTALHTWVGTHSDNCGSLKSFTIEDFDSQPNEIQLESNAEELNVAIYPVPVANVLNIVANANIENVIIYTSLGSEVKTVAKQNQIDVSTLLSGDYFVRIVTDKGVVTKSIIVVK